MSEQQKFISASTEPVRACARWRPILPEEQGDGSDPLKKAVQYGYENNWMILEINRETKKPNPLDHDKHDSVLKAFTDSDSNQKVFDEVVKPMVPLFTQGKICNVFAWGETGSGKTHTILGSGPSPENQGNIGLFFAAAKELFEFIKNVHESKNLLRNESTEGMLPSQVAVKICTVIGNMTIDRNGNKRWYYPPEYSDMRIFPSMTKVFSSYEELATFMNDGSRNETLDKISKRSETYADTRYHHTVFQLEVTNPPLSEYREEVDAIEVQLGKIQNGIMADQKAKGEPKAVDLDKAKKEWNDLLEKLGDMEKKVEAVKSSTSYKCFSGRMLFVDLAGSEAEFRFKNTMRSASQTNTEHELLKASSTALQALHNVFCDRRLRNGWGFPELSILTRLLHHPLVSPNQGSSVVICTLIPLESNYYETCRTLKKGDQIENLVNPPAS